MGEHTGRIDIARSAEEVFAFVSDIRNLPAFLAGVRTAGLLGAGRVVVEGAHNGRRYRVEGWLRADRDALAMEWGLDAGAAETTGQRGYSGSLRVVPMTRGGDRDTGAAGPQQAASLELCLRIAAEPPRPTEAAQATGRNLRPAARLVQVHPPGRPRPVEPPIRLAAVQPCAKCQRTRTGPPGQHRPAVRQAGCPGVAGAWRPAGKPAR